MSFLASVAWRNLWRHRRRSLITAGAMAVGVGLSMAMIAYTDGMFAQMFRIMVEQQLGHAQIHHPDYPGRRLMYDTVPASVLERVESDPHTVAVAPRLYGGALLGGRTRSTGALLQAIDPLREDAFSSLSDQLIDGEWLPAEPSGQIVLGAGLADTLDVTVGDDVVAVTQAADGSIGNALYQVSGVYETGSVQLDKAGAILHLADLQDLLVLPDQVHQLSLLSDNPRDGAISAWTTGLAAGLADVLVPVEDREVGEAPLLVQPWWEASPPTAQMMSMRDASAAFILLLVFSVAVFGVLNTMLMSVFERTRELGVLKALGLRPRHIVAMVIYESVFLAGVSVALGLVVGGVLDALLVVYGLDLGAQMEGGMTFNGVVIDPHVYGEVRPEGVILTAVAVFLVSIVASLWPAWRAARLDPIKSLRHE